MKFLALNGRVFVVPQPKKKTVSGLHLPDINSLSDATVGIGAILAYDVEHKHELNDKIRIGSVVLFNKHAAVDTEIIEGQPCKVMTKDNIYGIYDLALPMPDILQNIEDNKEETEEQQDGSGLVT